MTSKDTADHEIAAGIARILAQKDLTFSLKAWHLCYEMTVADAERQLREIEDLPKVH
jgi:hypothetical protein